MHKIEFRDPQDLKLDPLRRAVPRDKDHPEIDRLSDSIRLHGFLPEYPLIIRDVKRPDGSVDGYILHGEARWLAAKKRQLPQVPIVHCTTAPATTFLLSLVGRHLSKGAIAYLAVPLAEKAVDEGKDIRVKNLVKGQCSSEIDFKSNSGKTPIQEVAELLNISVRELDRAREVWKKFQSPEKLPWQTPEGEIWMTAREWFEPKLLAQYHGDRHIEHEPIGLGGIMKALGGKPSQRREPQDEQLDMFGHESRDLLSRLLKLPTWQGVKARLEEAVERAIEAGGEDAGEKIERFADDLKAAVRAMGKPGNR